ncbi:MAG: hypothetical protein K6C94_07100 [Candidatus Gastranaerophilales bacterium]|nr:hypothetical protein [Candidatus Gastranaerophilales bacterium]
MGISNDFSKYLMTKLQGLSAQNITKSGSLSFGSDSALKDYMSIFQQNGIDISSVDYNEIMEALNSGSLDGLSEESQNIAALINELLSIEDFSKLADTSGDETVDSEELAAIISQIAGMDGNNAELTYEDINAMFDKMGIDLEGAAENAVKEALNEAAEEAKAEKEKEAEEKAAEAAKQAETAPAQSAPSAGGASPAGGGSAPSGAGRTNSPSGKGDGKTEAPKTAEEIKQAIAEKEGEITTVENEADQKVNELEEKKQKALDSAGIPKEKMEEYKKQEAELNTKIQDKETAISDKDDQISDMQSTKSSNEDYIGSLDEQISQNEAAKGKISDSDEEGASKQADIDSKISNLKQEKEAKQEENNKLQHDIEEAEKAKAELKSEKATLEKQKSELLDKVMNESRIPGSEQEKVKETIKGYEEEITQVKNEKNEKVNGLKAEIKDLQVELKNAEAAEERAAFIQENKAQIGLGLTGEELVDVAKQMLEKYGSSSGYCATGVSRTFAMAYGLNLHGNGCDWDSNMDSLVEQGYFVEVTGDYATSADLANCPAGAVVCWENTGGHNGGGAQYGHVTIADGQGGEISDHYAANIYQSIGGGRTQYRVYLPVESA